MQKLIFEGDGDRKGSLLYSRFQRSANPPGLITFLIKCHIVKNEHQAKVVLMILCLLLISLSIFFFIQTILINDALKTFPLK